MERLILLYFVCHGLLNSSRVQRLHLQGHARHARLDQKHHPWILAALRLTGAQVCHQVLRGHAGVMASEGYLDAK